MEESFTRYSVHDYRHEVEWPVVVSGLWLRLAFISASCAAFGVAALMTGVGQVMVAAACVLGGGLVAAFSVRRSLAALDRADKSNADVVAPSPTRAVAPARENGAALTMVSLHR
jgi:hypothetical protein